MTLASRACLWGVVLGLFVWYGGRSGAAGADVLPTEAAAGPAAATVSPPRVCVVQIMASGEVVSVFVDHPTHPTIAMLVPPDTATNVPVSCQDLTSLGLTVANQEPSPVSVQMSAFTHQGASLCARGPFILPEHGARGVVFGSDCVEAEAGPKFEPNIGTRVAQCDDCSVPRTLPFPFTFFGRTYTTVFVNNNGHLTFSSSESDFTETVDEFTRQARISAFWDDLDGRPAALPEAGLYVNDQMPDRFVVTWFHQQEYGGGGDSTIQATLFADGGMLFTYHGLTAWDAIVGITPGGAVPVRRVDYSANLSFRTTEPTTILEQFTTGSNRFDLDGGFIVFTPKASGGYDMRVIPPPGTGQETSHGTASGPNAPVLGGTAQGLVIGPDARPLAGVELLVTCSCDLAYEGRTMTDQHGRYALSGIPIGGGVNIVAVVDGVVVARGGSLLREESEHMTIDVQPPSSEHKPEP
jgi:hypothetical protein